MDYQSFYRVTAFGTGLCWLVAGLAGKYLGTADGNIWLALGMLAWLHAFAPFGGRK